MSIPESDFRQALSKFASGVTVITSRHGETPIGITASSFSSLSVAPPLILVAVHKNLFTHKVISESGSFAVNVLGASQVELGMRFAGMQPDVDDRFADLAVHTAVTGSPLLPGCMAWIDCEVWAVYDGGDHSIFVGEVKALETSNLDSPLLYHDRLWRRTESITEPGLPLSANIIEVGPRDGFQRQQKHIPVDQKVSIINRLAASGLKRIQVTSFVHPNVVPQMADAEAVCAALPERPGVQYSALVLNQRGLERAYKAGIKHVETGVPATETLAQRNARYSVEEGMELMTAMAAQAHEWGMTIRVGVQVAFGCAFEGDVERSQVVNMVRRFLATGADEISLSDSAGLANPQQIRRTVQEVLPLCGDVPLILHLHDTRGQGLANALSALKSGVTFFDTALGGLGGCPFIETAKGNIATEDTVHMLHEMGIDTGIDVSGVAAASREVEQFLDLELPAKMHHLIA
jgi:hydroxymethylglutaryl-CoA lyase